MNRERAETHLRLLAEAELRRVAAHQQDSDVALSDLPGAGPGALDLRQRSAAAAALYDLPKVQREVIALQYYASLSEAETASAMRMSQGAVKSFTTHGMAALRAALEADTTRLTRAARVLTAVRALDDEAADQVLDDFALAIGIRQADPAGPRGPDPRSALRSSAAHLPLEMLMSSRPSTAAARAAAGSRTAVAVGGPGPAGSRTPSYYVVRVDQMVPVRDGDVSGEMHLLSYARTAAGARFTLVARARGEFVPPGIEHGGMYRPFAIFPVHQFIATDDQGTSYTMGFNGRRGRRPTELAGQITLHPDPPSAIRWLDLITTPGEPAVRIDLNPPAWRSTGTDVTVSEAAASPGEHLLNNMASRLLLVALAFPQEIRLHPAAPKPEPFACFADGLGDVIAALQACGALSSLSPVPGRLAALCARLNVTGHGITAPPARGLPEPWLSLLAHYHRRKPETGQGWDGCAAVAAVFPELDGIGLALLGLHNHDDRSVLYVQASGMPPGGNGGPGREPHFWLRIWVRDSSGQWHATRATARCWSQEDGREVTMRLEVVPPLSRATTWIEVLAAAPSAEARATLPLRWH